MPKPRQETRVRGSVTEYRCGVCLLFKTRDQFHLDRSKPLGITAQCADCRNKYSKKYYAANPEQIVENVMAHRQSLPPLPKQSRRFHSVKVEVKFEPAEIRRVCEAYEKQYGQVPTDEELAAYLVRHSRAGVLGNAKYILEIKKQ